ncbi:uncharacterized protein V1518DRAFT_409239 [Limtongia smithiae]|uniref:uncharacterized protein n=1 Tax=Limtongia smithiae TaxID=1125753 RepID=UPI0034CFD5B6
MTTTARLFTCSACTKRTRLRSPRARPEAAMPSPTFLVALFRKQIWYALDNGLDETACFTAERLVGQDPTNLDNVHLWALCLYRMGRYKIAMHVAEEKEHIGCIYIIALCCLKLGKFRMGCRTLESHRALWPKTSHIYNHGDSDRQALPDYAAVQCLLGHLYRQFGDSKEAVACYSAVLSINPFLWEALDGLCRLEVTLKVSNIYRVTPAMMAARSTWFDNVDDLGGIENSQNQDPFMDGSALQAGGDSASRQATRADNSNDNQPFAVVGNSLFPTRYHSDAAADADGDVAMHTGVFTGTQSGAVATPAMDTPVDNTRPSRSRSRVQIPDAPRRITSARSTVAETSDGRQVGDMSRRSSQFAHNATPTANPNAPQHTGSSLSRNLGSSMHDESASPRHQLPLLTTSALRGKLRSSLLKPKPTGTATGTGLEGIPNRRTGATHSDQHSVKVAADDAERVEAEMCMLSLFETFAHGTVALSRFDCHTALRDFLSLPKNDQMTPFALSKIGRAYFEIVRYKEAEEVFVKLRLIDPMRLEDMEIYSTLLWHLRKDVELSFLAHELSDIDRNAPQTWIAIGNSFSLQKEHDQALTCFRRAAHLDPTFAYAYTLQGHEHVSNEEYESAQNSFRLAMRAEWRHYNAWYGIGMLFLKTGKFELAEQHFIQAARINPGNAVLICCIGMVLEKLHRDDEALTQYDIACSLQPMSALPRFKKARLLMSMQKYDECMKELQIVKNLAPDESSVHYLLGRLCKIQGNNQSAIRHFTAALNLDPKASHVIKEAIEGLDTEMGP